MRKTCFQKMPLEPWKLSTLAGEGTGKAAPFSPVGLPGSKREMSEGVGQGGQHWLAQSQGAL